MADGETKPMNNFDTNDADVQFKGSGKKKGVFFTRAKIGLGLFLLFVLLLVILGIVSVLAWQLYSCHSSHNHTEIEDGVILSRPTRVFISPDPVNQPWAGIKLFRFVIPSHYKLHLKVDIEKFTFEGSVDIHINVTEPTKYIVVHSNGLKIYPDQVTVQGLTSGGKIPVGNKFEITLNQFYVLDVGDRLRVGYRYKVRFGKFTGRILDDLRGLYRSSYRTTDGTTRYLAASQLQSVDARKVFPCFDEPDLKATFDVTITHRGEYRALSNMPRLRMPSVSSDYPGWYTTEFKTTPIMSTYLLAFVVSDFKYETRMMPDNLEIRIWAQPEMHHQTLYALSFAGKVFSYFSSYFQMKEVVPKTDHVAVPDFSAGAMENWGLVLYRESTLLHDEEVSSVSNKYWVSLVMAHEIAHTWFGNIVTMRWWDDLWLNEGFANTLMYFAVNDIEPDWKVFDMQLVNNLYPVMTKDSLLTSHAISTPIKDPDDIPQFFDSISYDKGMAVLRLLRGFLGWDQFQKGLQMYVKKYKFSNAKMTELWQTFQEAVDNKYAVANIMDTWTRQMGFPVVSIHKIGPDTYRLDQERFLLNTDDRYKPEDTPYGYRWQIPFEYMYQTGGIHRAKLTTNMTWLQMGSAEIKVPGANWLLGNVGYMGFYRTNYDEDMWKKLTEQLHNNHTVFSAANRAGLINDAFNLARANKLRYAVALNLASYLKNEEDFVPWQSFLDSIRFLRGMLATSDSFGLLQRYLYRLVKPVFEKYGLKDEGSLLERKLRNLMFDAAASVGIEGALEQARADFKGWKNTGKKVQADYAVVVYSVGIQEEGEEEWDFLWNKAKESRVASEVELMMKALAHTQHPWLLWRYARWSLDSSKIRMQDVRSLFRHFTATPLSRSVALQFVLTNWKVINDRFGVDVFLLRDVIYATTSLINTEFEYSQLDRLYKTHRPAGVASKAAQNSLALIRSNIDWMKLHNRDILEWLEANVPSSFRIKS